MTDNEKSQINVLLDKQNRKVNNAEETRLN